MRVYVGIFNLVISTAVAFVPNHLYHPYPPKLFGATLRVCGPLIRRSIALQKSSENGESIADHNRRIVWKQTAVRAVSLTLLGAALVSITRPAWAVGDRKSRSEGYAVQKTENEWKTQLSSMQYYVLRQGGTEAPGFSVLQGEKRPGVFECVACGTPLFDSQFKFNSGTGWPSFARGMPGIEVEQLNPVQASLGGAELRCGTCGGHLGDVFQDGFLFIGTEAQKSGQRYCIDGAALLFRPIGDEESPVRGDLPAKTKKRPSWLDPPEITPKE
jgi:peptide-methionine (R)-S-oxide reductase